MWLFPHIGLIYALYMVGTSNKSVPDMARKIISHEVGMIVGQCSTPRIDDPWCSLYSFSYFTKRYLTHSPIKSGQGESLMSHDISIFPWKLSWYHHFQWSNHHYPPVNVYITMLKNTIFALGKSTISIVIFHGYDLWTMAIFHFANCKRSQIAPPLELQLHRSLQPRFQAWWWKKNRWNTCGMLEHHVLKRGGFLVAK